MNIFVQGMRRSGTTILFDLFWEDKRFDCYYEPLAAAKESLGGGSGVHDAVDFFQNVRACRKSFQAEHPEVADINWLNYGAPRDALLEFETIAPPYIKGYIEYMLSQRSDTFIKFTRMYCKIRSLFEIDPAGKLIHIVRDPKLVTASYLFGKNQKNKYKFKAENDFFEKTSKRLGWSSDKFSDYIFSLPEYSYLDQALPDFMRILLVWKYTFQKTFESGQQLFGDNYLLLRHEDLILNAEATIHRIYDFVGKDPEPSVLNWAQRNVRDRLSYYAQHNPAWEEAFQILRMKEALKIAGY